MSALNGRTKPLVRYVVRPAAGSGLGVAPMGIVTTHGADEPLALLMAAKRWRMSQRQLVAIRWDDCDALTRFDAAVMERIAAEQCVDECRSALATGGERDVTPAWRAAIGGG